MFAKVLAVSVLVVFAVANPVPGHEDYAISYVTKDLQTTDLNGGHIQASSAAAPIISNSIVQEGNYQYYHAHPKYNFKYGVEDFHTGDKKSQYEERDGDNVRGEYTVVQPDGHVRTVKYTVGKHHGFIADVYIDGKLINHGARGGPW